VSTRTASPPRPAHRAAPADRPEAPEEAAGGGTVFLRNVRALLLGGIGTGAVRALRSVVLSRLLGPAGYGHLDLAIFFSRTLASLARLGLADATVRFGAGLPAPKARLLARRSSAVVALAAALLAPIGAILSASALGRAGPEPIVVAAAAFAAVPPLAVADVARSYFLARQDFATPTRVGLATALGGFLLEALAVLAGLGVPGVLGASLLVSIGALAAFARACERDRAADAAGPSLPSAAGIARYAAARFALGALALVTWTRFEVAFLGHYWNASEVAFYALPFGVVGAAVQLLPGSISAVLPAAYPERRARGGEAAAAALYRGAFFQMAAVGLPLGALGAVLAGPLVSLVFSESFLPCVPVVRVLAVGAVLSMVTSAASHLVLSSSRASWMIPVVAAGAAANVGLDFAWIPCGGALGAAWANTASQLFESALSVAAAAAACSVRPPVGRLATLLLPLAACVVVGILAMSLLHGNPWLGAGLGAPAMAAAYYGVGRVTGAFRREDLEALRVLLRVPRLRSRRTRA
jgi:O-antigen/teichoic acid export membrane protein